MPAVSDLKKTSATGLPGTANGYPGTGNADKVGGYVIQRLRNVWSLRRGHCLLRNMDGPWRVMETVSVLQTHPRSRWAVNLWRNLVWKTLGRFQTVPDLKVTATALYIGDTTKNGNTVATL